MFSQTADWYDALYRGKDYASEAEAIRAVIAARRPGTRTVLDVGCGTAEHNRHLGRHFRVDGIDINPDFVRIAREKCPEGRYAVADMTAFDLGRTYDVVACLFSSIGYVKTLDRMESALAAFRAHLAPGGIVLIEPWMTPEAWNPDGRVRMLTAETPRGSICRMNVSRVDGRLSILEFHYLIGTAAGIRHVTEVHELGLFTVRETLAAFERAGLRADHDPGGPTGRGLYIATAA